MRLSENENLIVVSALRFAADEYAKFASYFSLDSFTNRQANFARELAARLERESKATLLSNNVAESATNDQRKRDLLLAVHETLATLGEAHEWDAHEHRRVDLERGIISDDYAIGLARGVLRHIRDYLGSTP